MDQEFIVSKICDRLTLHSDYHSVDIVNDIQTEFGVEIDYYEAFQVKEVALQHIHGSHEEWYHLLSQ